MVSGLVSAAAGAAVDVATATPDRLGWVAAAALLVVGTIGLSVWEAGRDARAESARARAARAEVMDPFWPTPITPAESGLDAPPDGLLFWLRAPFCPSPLRGRADVVRSLTEWCATGTDHVRIVSGPAGVGKSRLVVEVARRLGDEWFTGKPDVARLAEAVERVVACGRPALLVVEDAERIPGVARLVARVAGTDGLVRLVLTSRDGPELRQRLRQDPDTSLGPVLRAPVVELAPVGKAGDRQRWYAEAVAGYAHALRMPQPDVIDTAPAGHDGDLMLLLQARALLAVLNRPGSRTLGMHDVARELVGMETRRWTNDPVAALPAAITGESLAQALAVLSLLPTQDAADRLRRLPRLAAGTAEQHRLAIVAWARARYPCDATGRLEVQPHLIGEWLILDTLATVPTLTADLPATVTTQVVDTIARACATYPDHLPQLWTTLRTNPDRLPELIPLVIRRLVGGDRPDVIRVRVDQAIEQLITAADPGLDDAFLALDLPPIYIHSHIALLRIRIRTLRAGGEGDRRELAAVLTDLGTRLRHAGRRQEALATDNEAVGRWRELIAAEPGRHRDELAVALSNLGNTTSQLSHHRDALAARGEAVAIWRELCDVEPDRYRPSFARAVSNIAGSLAQVGRNQDALQAWQQAVALWRELAAGDPIGFAPTLAIVLSGLCLILRETGLDEESVAAGEESVAIWRGLPAAELDRHRADFAGTLTKLAVGLRALGRGRDALAAVEEAVDQWRRLAAAQPDRHRPGLADALISLGVHLTGLGRRQEALTASQEAIGMWRRVVRAEPGHHRPRLAHALTQLAVDLTDAGDHRKAVATSEEAIGLWRELVAAEPDRYRPDLAYALNNLGTCHERAGDRGQAREGWTEALGLLKICADRDPRPHRERYEQLAKLLDGI